MLFQDKPLEVIYFEDCIMQEHSILGRNVFGNEEWFLKALGGSDSDAYEIAGMFLARNLTKKVIADLILQFRINKVKASQARLIRSKYTEVIHYLSNRCALPLRIIEIRALDPLRVAEEVFRCLENLFESGEEGFKFEMELSVGQPIIDFRHQVMRDVPATWLWKLVRKELSQLLEIEYDSI